MLESDVVKFAAGPELWDALSDILENPANQIEAKDRAQALAAIAKAEGKEKLQ